MWGGYIGLLTVVLDEDSGRVGVSKRRVEAWDESESMPLPESLIEMVSAGAAEPIMSATMTLKLYKKLN